MANDATLVGLGPLNVGSTWVTIVGLVVTAILLVRRVRWYFYWDGDFNDCWFSDRRYSMPDKIISSAPSLEPTFLVALGHVKDINTIQMWVVVLTFY